MRELPLILLLVCALFAAYISGHNDGYELAEKRCEHQTGEKE